MKFSDDQLDVLTELVNIGVGRAAASLSDLVEKRIDLCVPSVTVSNLDTLSACLVSSGKRVDTLLVQDFHGALSGRAVLAFPRTSGLKLGQILGGLDSLPDEFDLDLTEILTEVANIVLNGVLGSVSNILESMLSYSVPEFSSGCELRDFLKSDGSAIQSEQPTVVFADTRFRVEDSEINGSLVILFELRGLWTALDQLAPSACRTA